MLAIHLNGSQKNGKFGERERDIHLSQYVVRNFGR